MKKRRLLIAFIVISFVFLALILNLGTKIVAGAVSAIECTDSDKGQNFQIKGTSTGIYAGASEGYHIIIGEEPDPKTSKTSPYNYSIVYDYCFDKYQITESWCSDGKIQNGIFLCRDYIENSICSNGTCITNPLATSRQCSEFGYNKQYGIINYCDDNRNSYDLSVCSNVTYTCSDSDSGADYYKVGQISVGSSSKQGPSCDAGISPTGGSGGGGGTKDSCLNSYTLKERICNADGTAGIIEYYCPNGCKDGACIQTTNATACEEREEPDCAGAYNTGKKDERGCYIYACPSKCEDYSYNECPLGCSKINPPCLPCPVSSNNETEPTSVCTPCRAPYCATPGQKEVYLNQKFELKSQETVNVVDYKNMEIKSLGLIEFRCKPCTPGEQICPTCVPDSRLRLQVSISSSGGTGTTTQTKDAVPPSLATTSATSTSSTSVGGSGGSGGVYCEDYPFSADCICREGKKSQKPCNPPVNGGCSAVVSYECLNASSSGGSGTGTVFDLAPGEKKEVFGASISLLKLERDIAVLVVEEQIIIKPVCGNGICEVGEGEICTVPASSSDIFCGAGKECNIPTPACKFSCPQDCSKYETIPVNLGEKFKLHISQTGSVEEDNLKITFKNMIASRCKEEVVSSQASAVAIKEKVAEAERSLTGSVVSDLSTDKPISVLRCTGSGPKALISYQVAREKGNPIKGGVLEIDLREKKRIGDIFSIAFLDYDYASRTGAFLLNNEKFECPERCKCDSEGNTIECPVKRTCEVGEILCPDGKCRDKCEVKPNEEECKYGCNYEGSCFPMGVRSKGLYCGNDLVMNSQKNSEQICENNFECTSNVCVSGKCISKGLMNKILDFFKRLFGAG